MEDTPLSPEEQKMVQDFAEKIDLTNSQMILQYGAASQKKLSDFSDSALSRVRTKDMGETGELIAQLIGELKGFDATAENQKGFLGFFKKFRSIVQHICYAHKNMSFNYMIKNNYTIYKNIIQYNKQYVVIKNVDIL